jgi:hypothetical protein
MLPDWRKSSVLTILGRCGRGEDKTVEMMPEYGRRTCNLLSLLGQRTFPPKVLLEMR